MYNDSKLEEIGNGEKINPWLHIWTKPRATVRSAIYHNSIGLAFVLAMIAGIATTWDNAISENAGGRYLMEYSLLGLIIGIIIIGSLLGLLTWVFVASTVTFVGRWLGGQGTVKELLIATGIAYVPIALLLSFNIIDLLLLGENIFIDAFITEGNAMWLMFSGVIASIVGIWNIVISLKSIGEAHRFSAWRALASIIIVIVMLFVVLAFFLYVPLMMF